MAQSDEVFEVSGVGSRQPRVIAQTLLTDIIQPRAEEIAHLVRNEIRNAGYERQTGAGVVLTGGGSMLRGFVELAESILDLPVRIGASTAFAERTHTLRVADNGTKGNTPEMPRLKDPEFATIAGLVLYGDRRRKTHDFHENSGSGFKKLAAKFRSFL